MKESSSAATVAAAPCGLCAASSTIVGDRRTISSRPGEVTSREGLGDQLGVERVLAAEERLDGRERERGVLGLVGSVERQEDVLVGAAQRPAGRSAARRRPGPGGDPEVDAFAQRVAPTSATAPDEDAMTSSLHRA